MKVAITGGTGFVGSHLAERLPAGDVRLVSRSTGVPLDDVAALAAAFAGCEVVAHLAGINRELGGQTYRRVHVDGTRNVIEAARLAGVRRIVLLSFIKARPGSGSPYHESKWAAEQLVRGSGLEFTVLKAGMIYGRGDHLLDHLSHTVHTVPLFASVGLRERPIRPVPIAELTDVLVAAVQGRLPGRSVEVLGAEELLLSAAVRRVAAAVGRRVLVLPAPAWFHLALAQLTEWTMTVPLVAKSQVRMLLEGVTGPGYEATPLPADLEPRLPFGGRQVADELPPPGGFGPRDLLVVARLAARRTAAPGGAR